MLRDGLDIPGEFLARFSASVSSYRNQYQMTRMAFRPTLATRDVGMFLPIFSSSFKIFSQNREEPVKESLFMFPNNDLIEKDGGYQVPFLIRYFEWIIMEGRIPTAKEIVYIYPNKETKEI
jgi:hypothetical protein